MSKIEWTQKTWNPIAGCTVHSAGCTNCYAMRMAARLEAMDAVGAKGLEHYRGLTQPSKAGPVWTGKIGIAGDDAFLKPLRWKKPRMIFVNSMADLFHEDVPDAVIDKVFAVMALDPQHTFQILTKRAARMRDYLTAQPQPEKYRSIDDAGNEYPTPASFWRAHSAMCDLFAATPTHQLNYAALVAEKKGRDGFMPQWPLPNVWLGVSVEDQRAADDRIPHLLATPAAVRWISAEPLLGPISLAHVRHPEFPGAFIDALDGYAWQDGDAIHHELPGLDWVVTGGESGPGARDNDFITNARSLRDQCASANVPFFGKQGFRKAPLPDDLNIRQWPKGCDA